MVRPSAKRQVVDHFRAAYGVSERRAIRATGTARSSYRYRSRRDPQTALRMRMKELAAVRVRYGYRRLHVLLQREGWSANHKRIYRLYCEEGLSIRTKTPRRRRSCRYRVGRPAVGGANDTWAMDFVAERLFDGRPFRILTVVDCHTREALVTCARTKFRAYQVIEELDRLARTRGKPRSIRVDNVLTWQSMGKTRQQISLRRCVPVAGCRNKNQVASTVQGCALNHSELRIRTNVAVLTVLKTRYATKWKARTLSTGSQVELRPHGSVRAKSFHLAPADRRTAGSRLRSGRSHARRAPSWRRRP